VQDKLVTVIAELEVQHWDFFIIKDGGRMGIQRAIISYYIMGIHSGKFHFYDFFFRDVGMTVNRRDNYPNVASIQASAL
jgi:hypothetical protein